MHGQPIGQSSNDGSSGSWGRADVEDQETAFVVHDGPTLRCGGCRRPVGSLRWDSSGWPHTALKRKQCVECGRLLIVSPERLEAETVSRYLAS
jgi:hypothetical protein